MFHPAAIQIVDEHSDAQLGGIDFLEHDRVWGCVNLAAIGTVQF
jgi:hypothetical protein